VPVSDFSDLFEAKGRQYNVDPALLATVAQQESSGNPKALGPETKSGRAKGLMQIVDHTAAKLGIDPYDPAQAIDGGARLLAQHLDKFGNVGDALAAYYGGPDPQLWGPKTRKYRETVLAKYQGSSPAASSAPVASSEPSDAEVLALASGAPATKSPPATSEAAPAPADAPAPTAEPTDEDILKMASGEPIAGAKNYRYQESFKRINDLQQPTVEAMVKGRQWDNSAPEGSQKHPYMMAHGQTEENVPEGAFYIDLGGKLSRRPMPGDTSDLPKGFGQGLSDVMLSAGRFAPGSQDSEILQSLVARQMGYDAQYKGDIPTGLARFGGQMTATLPAMAGGEAAVAPILGRAGAVGEFLAGKAGQAALPEGAGIVSKLLNTGLKTGSKAALGAREGALASGLVSSAGEGPAGEQMKTGALLGAGLGVGLPLVSRAGRWTGETARDLVQPLTTAGREQIANRMIGKFAEGSPIATDAGEIIPGSVPTLAQATANPGIATLERTVRLSRPTPFAERAAQNNEARAVALDAARGDPNTVADLVASRDAAVSAARQQAFDGAQTVNSGSLVGTIDRALEAPAAHMEAVAKPLQQLRDKIVQPVAETTPEQTAQFNRRVSQTFGANAPALTPEVMQAARTRLGEQFERIAGATHVPWDDTLRKNIGQVIADTAQVVPESQLPPLFKQLDNIVSTANDGKTISGASYQALTRKGSPLDSLMKSGDPTIRQAAGAIREALDDALERRLGAEGTGATNTLAELRNARLQYKNLKTVEAALRSAGPDHQVTPQAVLSAVKRNFGNYAYQGGGGLGDVAEAAVREISSRTPQVEGRADQVFGMRQSLDSAIQKLSKGETDADQQAAQHLMTVRDALDAEIDRAAPGYAQYLETTHSTAEPIAAQRFLQTLRLTDAKGSVTLGRLDSAMKRIADMRAKPGANPAKSITQETLDQLERLHADLVRESNSGLGRPIGSDTAQHLATGNIGSKMGVPLALGAGALMHNPVAAAAIGAGKLFYGMKNEQITDALATKLLQPEAGMLNVTPKKPGITALVGRGSVRAAPIVAGALNSRMVGSNRE
jgi:hypothetical protein